MALSLIRKGVPGLLGGDAVSPSCVLSSADPDPVLTETFSVMATFSEDVFGFVVGDITVTNGSASGFIAATASIYTFTITPVLGSTPVTVNVGAGVCTDAALNPNTASNTISRDWYYLEAFLKSEADDVDGSVTWDHQEETGDVLGAYNSALATGRDVVINGDFATDTIWVKEDVSVTIAGGVADFDVTPNVKGVTQSGLLSVGKTYTVTFTILNHVAGTIQPLLGGTGLTGAAADGTFVRSGTCTADGTLRIRAALGTFEGQIDNVIVTQTGILASSAYVDPANNPLSGTHTGVTVGQAATGALGLAVLDDGTTSYSDIYSAEMNSVFSPTQGTLLIFARVSGAGVWSDGTARNLYMISADAQNLIRIRKTSTNDQISCRYIAGGTADDISTTSLNGTVDWFMVALTWDTGAANETELFINGSSVGTSSTLGAFVGNLASTATVLAARSTVPQSVWDGYRTHAFYTPEVKDSAWMLRTAQLAGVI